MLFAKKNTVANVPRSSKGRKKIEIKKIANKSSQQVTFSKRRAGLFKKAAELCILCGSQVGIIVFSPVHKIFTFGHPHIDTVIHRYLHGDADPEPPIDGGDNMSSIHVMNQQYEEAQKKLVEEQQKTLAIEAGKGISTLKDNNNDDNDYENSNSNNNNNNNNVGYWWDEPIGENIQVEELEQYMEAIEQLMKKVAMKVDNMMMRPFMPSYVPAMSITEGGGSGSGYCFSTSQGYKC